MTGHIHATALYGAPKLLWKPATHPNPMARVSECQETRCGTYRVYRQGQIGNWSAIYLPDPTHWSSIGIERSLDEAMNWVNKHHAARCRAAVQAQQTPGTGDGQAQQLPPAERACGPINWGREGNAT